MGKLFDIKRFKLYLWIGAGFLLVKLLGDLAEPMATYLRRALGDIWYTCYITVVNYLLFEFTLPKLSRKRIFWSFFRLAGHCFIYMMGLGIWRYLGIALQIYVVLDPAPSREHAAADMVGHAIGSVFFFGIIRHIYNHIMLKRSAQQLLLEKQQAELNYLKSQTNPHFLFNTLNNIYSLARDKSDLAPESIMRLSKILRYMLYEAGGPYAAIEQDLKIIGDYIALEKLRYDESLRINFNYDVEDMKQALPPLLLIPLVENAFKHGASETRNLPFVDIHLSVKNRQLSFIVSNSTGEPSMEGRTRESIGLSNLRRQLELLYTDYQLSLQQGEFLFTATLKINLASHV